MADSRQEFGTPTELQSQQGSSEDDSLLYQLQAQLPQLQAQLPQGVVKLPATAALEQVLAALWRDGAVVLTHAVSDDSVERCKAELEPYLTAQNADLLQRASETHGGNTRTSTQQSNSIVIARYCTVNRDTHKEVRLRGWSISGLLGDGGTPNSDAGLSCSAREAAAAYDRGGVG